MDVFQTPGAFSWNELMTPDPARAAAFYAELFGWTVEAQDMGDFTYHVLKVGTAMVGGMMALPAQPSPAVSAGWSSYVTVDSVDDTAAKCQALGGEVLLAPHDIPTVGRIAVLKDPTGAVINVIRYSS